MRLLGQVTALEMEAHRPLISAVVVRKDNGEPGTGFWRAVGDLGAGSGRRSELGFWTRELEACHAYWKER